MNQAEVRAIHPAPSSLRSAISISSSGLLVIVLATVLFLDIASSTERAAAMGDSAWRNLLNSYYSIVRKELARYRGKETNTTGDGFLATFDGPARGVRCALSIALAF